MSRLQSLRSSGDFRTVYQGGISKVNRLLVMIILENGLSENRYGLSVSKKVGNSVVRHRITRIFREIIRHNQQNIVQGYDIVIVARRGSGSRSYGELLSAVKHLLKLHHILRDDDQK